MEFISALEEADVIVQELFDDILSTEGVYTVIHEIQQELSPRLPTFIPQRGSSWFGPVRMPTLDEFSSDSGVFVSPTNKMLLLHNLSGDCFLSPPQSFEEIDFQQLLSGYLDVNHDGDFESKSINSFRFTKKGLMIGLGVFIKLHFQELEMSTLTTDVTMHWRNIIVFLGEPYLIEPIQCQPDDVLVIESTVTHKRHRPDYHFRVIATSDQLTEEIKRKYDYVVYLPLYHLKSSNI